MNPHISRVSIFSMRDIARISRIIEACGKNMYTKQNLSHWRNSFVKTFLIVLYTIFVRGMTLWKVSEDNNICATFQTKVKGEYLNFAKFAVDPDYEGKGLGTMCLEIMSNLAKEKNLKGLTCEVMAESQHALNFYLKRGFKEVGTRKTLKYTELNLLKEF